MPTIDVGVRRFSVVSQRPFEEVARRLTATIGRPNISALHDAVNSASTLTELESQKKIFSLSLTTHLSAKGGSCNGRRRP
jgi:hypothetical protein